MNVENGVIHSQAKNTQNVIYLICKRRASKLLKHAQLLDPRESGTAVEYNIEWVHQKLE
jgi:hypothetical protein